MEVEGQQFIEEGPKAKGGEVGFLSSRLEREGPKFSSERKDGDDEAECFDGTSLMAELENLDSSCPLCTEPLTPETACTAGDKNFHIACLQCSTCKDQIEDKFFMDLQEKIKCEKCYKEDVKMESPPKPCSLCGDPVEGEGVAIQDKPDQVYHASCFKCGQCNEPVQGKVFSIEGDVMCGGCIEQKLGNKICYKCGENIHSEDCLVSNDKKFHPNCMKCNICDVPLDGVYYFSKEQVLCEKDYKASQKSCSVCEDKISGTCYTVEGEETHFCSQCYEKRSEKQ